MARIMYRLLSLGAGVLGGVVAGWIFKKVWQLVASNSEPPKATDRAYSWAEVLPAAAIEGAIFALVKAAVSRAGAEGVQAVTGTWPAEDSTQGETGPGAEHGAGEDATSA